MDRGPTPEDRSEFGDRFLAVPDPFPGRASGQSWGDCEVEVDLVGGPYRFEGLAEEQAARIESRYKPFLAQAGRPRARDAVVIRFFEVRASDFIEFDRTGWETWIDFSYRPGTVRMAGYLFMGRIDWRPAIGAAVWTSVAGGEEFLGVVANVFRVLLAYRMLAGGGVLLHSAAVLERGQVFVFVGRSGAGKTTLSRMSRAAGREILSDDLNALRLLEGRLLVDKVPFAGDFGCEDAAAGSWPLGGLLRLRKGEGVALRPLACAEALASLVSCAPFVNRDPHRQTSLLISLEAIVDGFGVQELTFSLDGDVWSTLRAAECDSLGESGG